MVIICSCAQSTLRWSLTAHLALALLQNIQDKVDTQLAGAEAQVLHVDAQNSAAGGVLLQVDGTLVQKVGKGEIYS